MPRRGSGPGDRGEDDPEPVEPATPVADHASVCPFSDNRLKIHSGWTIFTVLKSRSILNIGHRFVSAIGSTVLMEVRPMASEIKQTLQDVRKRLNQIKEYL